MINSKLSTGEIITVSVVGDMYTVKIQGPGFNKLPEVHRGVKCGVDDETSLLNRFICVCELVGVNAIKA